MFDTLASVVLMVLAVIVLLQLARGTLGSWLSAKFLNRAPAQAAG